MALRQSRERGGAPRGAASTDTQAAPGRAVDGSQQDAAAVVVVSPARIYREGIAEGLSATGRFRPVAVAPAQANALVSSCRPAVVVFDISSESGLEAVRALVGLAPTAPVVVLGLEDADRDIVSWAEAGASGFVGRDAPLSVLERVVTAASAGELLCSPAAAAALCRRLATLARLDATNEAVLTRREAQIARLMEQGLTNKEIASALFIESATVKNHVHNILGKLGARRRAEAAAQIRRLHPELVGMPAQRAH